MQSHYWLWRGVAIQSIAIFSKWSEGAYLCQWLPAMASEYINGGIFPFWICEEKKIKFTSTFLRKCTFKVAKVTYSCALCLTLYLWSWTIKMPVYCVWSLKYLWVVSSASVIIMHFPYSTATKQYYKAKLIFRAGSWHFLINMHCPSEG